jgi:hypothetical protein
MLSKKNLWWAANLIKKADFAEEIAEEVDVIVNGAANTTFDERFLRLLLECAWVYDD